MKTAFYVLLVLVAMLMVTRLMGVTTDIAVVDGAVSTFMSSIGF